MSQYKYLAPLSFALLVFLLITACSPQSGGTAITEITWQWSSLTETQPASQSVVPDPENYTLQLGADGTLNIKADCNMVGGSYSLEAESLTINLGPSTMAFCGEQSLDLQYLELLAAVESFSVENDQLVLQLGNGAGSMRFTQ